MVSAIIGIVICGGFTWYFAWRYYTKARKANEDSTRLLYDQNKQILSVITDVAARLPAQEQERVYRELTKIKRETEQIHSLGVQHLVDSTDYIPTINRKCHVCNEGFIQNDSSDPSIALCDSGCGLRLKWSGKTWMEVR